MKVQVALILLPLLQICAAYPGPIERRSELVIRQDDGSLDDSSNASTTSSAATTDETSSADSGSSTTEPETTSTPPPETTSATREPEPTSQTSAETTQSSTPTPPDNNNNQTPDNTNNTPTDNTNNTPTDNTGTNTGNTETTTDNTDASSPNTGSSAGTSNNGGLTSSATQNNDLNGTLSKGAIGGIVGGVGAVLVAIAIGIFYRRRQNKNKETQNITALPPGNRPRYDSEETGTAVGYNTHGSNRNGNTPPPPLPKSDEKFGRQYDSPLPPIASNNVGAATPGAMPRVSPKPVLAPYPQGANEMDGTSAKGYYGPVGIMNEAPGDNVRRPDMTENRFEMPADSVVRGRNELA